jgi:dephospho-CoA kinase
MATQLPRSERLARADDVIDNSGPLAALADQIARLDAFYRGRAALARELEPASSSPQNDSPTRRA